MEEGREASVKGKGVTRCCWCEGWGGVAGEEGVEGWLGCIRGRKDGSIWP